MPQTPRRRKPRGPEAAESVNVLSRFAGVPPAVDAHPDPLAVAGLAPPPAVRAGVAVQPFSTQVFVGAVVLPQGRVVNEFVLVVVGLMGFSGWC